MNRILKVIIKYVISYIIVVIVYWLLYWIISWGLYGLARLSDSRPLMLWLSDYHNEFEPAKDYLDLIDSLDIANGVEYLNGNSVWVKDEMESIQCLKGLFDELKCYNLNKLLTRDYRIRESGYMREIVHILRKREHRLNKGELNPDLVVGNKINPEYYVENLLVELDSLI